jgi:Protein of unknown function (DUF2490)
MIRLVLLAMVISVAVPAAAQNDTEPRLWTAVTVQGRVSSDSPWRWAADSLVRTRDGAGAIDVAGEWVTVTRDLTRRSVAGVGYAYMAGFPDNGTIREHRLVQQYTWSTGNWWRASLKSRLEERFVKRGALPVRMRQQVRVSWPLAAKGMLRGIVSEEVLAKVNTTALARRGLDSNRLFLGLGRIVSPRTRIEVGYLNLYTRAAPNGKRRSHVMSAGLTFTL